MRTILFISAIVCLSGCASHEHSLYGFGNSRDNWASLHAVMGFGEVRANSPPIAYPRNTPIILEGYPEGTK